MSLSEAKEPKSNISDVNDLNSFIVENMGMAEGASMDKLLTPLITEEDEVMCLAWKAPDKLTYQLFYLENEACFNC